MAVHAQLLDTPQGFENLSSLSFNATAQWAISIVFVLAVVAFFFMFIFGGIRWMLSMGKKEKVEEAKDQIKHAFIGLLIVFLSWAGLALIGQMFGINLTQMQIPSM